MKKNLLFLFFFCFSAVMYSHAQVAINTDSSTADPSAILDLKSSDKGLLLPRMKDISTNPIANPKAGLLVYDSATKATWIYDGTSWVKQGAFTLPYSASTSSSSAALSISNTATSGNAVGLYGSTSSASAGTGPTSGVTAVSGEVLPTSGGAYSAALRGINRSTTGLGIGTVGYQAGSGWGVYGEAPSGVGVYGNSTAGYGGYFRTASGKALFTSGSVQLTGIGEGAGKVLTSDANGIAIWQMPAAASSKVGFFASPTANILLNAYGSTTISSYRTPSFNDGNAFNSSTGYFTAPSDGLYHFDVTIVLSSQNGDIDNSPYLVRLNVNGSAQQQVSNNIALIDGYGTSIIMSVNQKLEAGDQVNLYFLSYADQKTQVDSNGSIGDTYFSGYQVY